MAMMQVNDFTSYNLTPQELMAGQMLTVAQVMNIQNYLSQVAIRKLNLKYDPLNPVAFAQQEAEMQGQITVLRQLLQESEDAINEYNRSGNARKEPPQENRASEIFPPVPDSPNPTN